MFSLHGRLTQLCDRITRRELMRIGGLSGLGLSLPSLLRTADIAAREAAGPGVPSADKTFGRAKNVIYLYLQGGPPQHETFDPKPEAPAEVRGPFRPIQTNVPGIQFCELLPRIARMTDKLAIVRSLSTDDNNHDSSGYWVLTGYKYRGPNSRTIQPTDWPYFGSLVKKLRPSDVLPPLSTVWIPDMTRLNENVTPAGQTAGFLGGEWNPDHFYGDPAEPAYQVQGLRLTDLPPMQMRGRQSLLRQVESHFESLCRLESLGRGGAVQVYDKFQQQAFDLLTTGKAREAFDIAREPDKVRDRYGRNTWGQCCLLARRLIEAGVRLVHVNWPREPGDNAVDNPLWDTHAQNADRLEDVLCPQFDVSFTALIEDLDRRGLLAETLVVAIGEFGRTPKINGNGGRDHWGPVFSFALAGAGISGGQVYGASDKQGAYPARDRVLPGELTATIFHLLGIPHQGTFPDREGRPHSLTEEQPLFKLLGTEPATAKRTIPGGDVARVPPFDRSLLLNADFSAGVPLVAADAPSRPKGWRAWSMPADRATGSGFEVSLAAIREGRLVAGHAARSGAIVALAVGSGALASREKAEEVRPRVAIGFMGSTSADTPPKLLRLSPGVNAFLAQEVRSPFAGRFILSVHACGTGTSREFYEGVFLKHFTCRLAFYQYANPAKKLAERRELASITFQPKFVELGKLLAFERVKLSKLFANPTPGANHSFGAGLGVGVYVEKTTPDTVDLKFDHDPPQAYIVIDRVDLVFAGKERNEKVTV